VETTGNEKKVQFEPGITPGWFNVPERPGAKALPEVAP